MQPTTIFLACAVAASLGAPPATAEAARWPALSLARNLAFESPHYADAGLSTLGDQGKGRGNQKKGGNQRAVERDERDDHNGSHRGARGDWQDGDRCRTVVDEYYDRRGLPPGLAKKGKLPPGLRKQLRERGHLPPGLEKHMVVVPVELERELPPLPPHHIRRFAGDDLLVIDVRSNIVVSIFAGVFIRR